MTTILKVSAKARQAIEEQGGSIAERNILWPQGTVQTKSSDRGAWGNFSFRAWKLPKDGFIIWDSEDRKYQFSSHD
jgi:hypothetical protein